jgi:hypothetical protein
MTINKAKDNLSSMYGLACEDLCSHMANSMWHSHRPPLKIRSMFYFHQGRQGPPDPECSISRSATDMILNIYVHWIYSNIIVSLAKPWTNSCINI